MQALVIVIPHVASEREAQVAVRRKPRAVDQLRLQRMKERLHMRVVARSPHARGALPDAQDPEAIAERLGSILAAAVTVEDEAGARAPGAHGRVTGCAPCWASMNANASAFVWPRTGWLFLGGRAPPATAHGRARAPGVGGSLALVAASLPAPGARAAPRRALPSATATT